MRSCLLVAGLLVGCSHASPSTRAEAPDRSPSSQPGPQAAATARPAPDASGPRARTVDVTETRFGITVSDPYRWMEGHDNPEATSWLDAQGDHTRAYLARLPGRNALLARIRELGNATATTSAVQRVGAKLFYLRTAPGDQLAKIVVREAGKERVLVDPATFDTTAGHVSVDGPSPSPDGSKLAYSVSSGGSEVSVTHVLDMVTGTDLADRVERTFPSVHRSQRRTGVAVADEVASEGRCAGGKSAGVPPCGINAAPWAATRNSSRTNR
jgi:protease II